MSTFQTQIEDLIGTDVNDTAFYTDSLTAGAKYVTDLLPKEKIMDYTTNVTDSGSGVSISGYRLLRAHKSGYGTREINAGLKSQAVNSDSIHYATSESPVHYIENGNLYVKPSGGTGIAMAYPSVLYSASTISGFPAEMNHSVVLYACIRGLERLISDNQNIVGAGTAPTALSAPSFTWTNATYTNTAVTETVDLASRLATLTTDLDTQEDIELSQAKIQEIRVVIEQFNSQSQIGLSQAQVNAKETTDIDLQNNIESMTKDIQQYQATVSRYSQELNKYQADINARIQKINTLQALLKDIEEQFNQSLQVLK